MSMVRARLGEPQPRQSFGLTGFLHKYGFFLSGADCILNRKDWLTMPFSGVACNRVFILGFDGAGAAPEQLKVPGIRRVFSQGAFTWKAQTAFPR